MPEGNLHGHMTGLGTLGGHMQGSGTTDYNELNNKPKINNVTLVGNKTSNDLNLQEKINFNGDASTYLDGEGNFTVPAGTGGSYSSLTDKPSINSVELDGNLSLSDLDIQEELDFPGDANRYLNGEGNFTTITVNYDNASNRPEINSHVLTGNQTSDDLGLQDKLPFNSDVNTFLNGAGSFTEVTADYSDLSNKPSINSIELDGNKTAAQLGLQEVINFPNDPDKYLDGQGIFKKPSYDDIDDRPAINSITLSGNQSGNDLELTSGPIASGSGTSVQFTAEGEYNLLKAEVEFEPVQDLHGYDEPWAPGAGKNKLDKNIFSGVTQSFQSTLLTLEPNTTYTMSSTLPLNNTNTANSFFYLPGTTPTTANNGVWNGQTRTVTTGVDGEVRVAYRTEAFDDQTPEYYMSFDFQIEVGSYATDYEPYSNICPITGYDNITINVSPSSDPSEGTDYTAAFDNTYYGGTFDFITGTINNTYGHIASYAGEVLPGEWISSLDKYIEGNNPTTGAEVAYVLSAPDYHYIDKTVIESENGDNYVSGSGLNVNVDAATEIFDPVLQWLVNHR